MIFALATDDGTLMLFRDAEEAVAHCEGVDVEGGNWEFWGVDGAALQASFSKPNEHSRWSVLSGVYSLRPNHSGPDLLSSLSRVRNLDSNPLFGSLAELAEHLANSGQLQHHGA